MNTATPRVFIAATRQNDGKTTVSLGLIAALQEHFPRIGYIKPVGQRFVEIEEQKIDEDTVLMDAVYQMNCPLVDMSPIAVEPDFTRKYLQAAEQRGAGQKNPEGLRPRRLGKGFCAVRRFRARRRRFGVRFVQRAAWRKSSARKSSSSARAASANRLTKSRSTRRCLKRKASRSSASSSTRCWRKRWITSRISPGAA